MILVHPAFPWVAPRMISDNCPQFITKDFKEFVRQYGPTHVRTALPGNQE
jgi:hypothetical protein